MVTVQLNTWIFWLISAFVVLGFMSVFYMITPRVGLNRCLRGIWKYYVNKFHRYKEHYESKAISFSAKFVKEITWFVVVFVIAFVVICYACGWCNVNTLISDIVDKVHDNFTVVYPLLTTIIGAFFALLCHFLFIHPKVYVSPDMSLYTDIDKKKRLSWFIENRSLFDCIDIHVDAFACKYMHDEDDLYTYRINLKRTDYTVLSGRFAASNDRSICVSTYSLPKELYIKVKNEKTGKEEEKFVFDYIELSVKVSHALSHVTKIITRQFSKNDIYNGEFHGGKKARLRAFENPRTTIKTVKAVMLQRFMYARKFETISLMGIMALMLLQVIWPGMCIEKLGLTSVLLTALSISLWWFSLIRLFFQFPTLTDEDDENKHYRANIDEDFNNFPEDGSSSCPYLHT